MTNKDGRRWSKGVLQEILDGMVSAANRIQPDLGLSGIGETLQNLPARLREATTIDRPLSLAEKAERTSERLGADLHRQIWGDPDPVPPIDIMSIIRSAKAQDASPEAAPAVASRQDTLAALSPEELAAKNRERAQQKLLQELTLQHQNDELDNALQALQATSKAGKSDVYVAKGNDIRGGRMRPARDGTLSKLSMVTPQQREQSATFALLQRIMGMAQGNKDMTPSQFADAMNKDAQAGLVTGGNKPADRIARLRAVYPDSPRVQQFANYLEALLAQQSKAKE